MAHKKGVGSSKNGRESESKRLGVKIFGGLLLGTSSKTRGSKHNPGENVYISKDHTPTRKSRWSCCSKRKEITNHTFQSFHSKLKLN
jgi:ribosomal protein L27